MGALAAGITANFSVRFLVHLVWGRTLTPFALYCGAMGSACLIVFA